MRIRSVKPEFWKSEKVATLPRDLRLLFIGLWNLADDFGRFRAHPSLVKGELFPYDDDATVGPWLEALERVGFVTLYTVGGQRYGFVRGFAEHQKLDKRAASRLPPPPGADPRQDGEASAEPADCPPPSPTPSRQPAAESPPVPAEKLAEPADFTPEEQGTGRGKEGKGLDPGKDHGPRARVGAREGPAPKSSQNQNQRDDGRAPVSELTSALLRTAYRSEAGGGNPIMRRGALGVRAAILAQTGLEAGHVADLWKLAQAKSTSDPGALLAHWLDGNTWREVLDEQVSKAKQAEASSRQRENPELLDGIYGAPPPAAAGDVVAQVIAEVREAARAQ